MNEIKSTHPCFIGFTDEDLANEYNRVSGLDPAHFDPDPDIGVKVKAAQLAEIDAAVAELAGQVPDAGAYIAENCCPARRAHARAIAQLDLRHEATELSDADLADLAADAMMTAQAQADLAGIGIRPAEPADDGDRFDGLS